MAWKHIAIVISVIMIGILVGCHSGTTVSQYSQPELAYRLISNFGDVFSCDPDYYPVAREGQEEQNALEQFSAIRSNQAEFSAILKHLDLPDKSEYTTEEKILIYREHKELTLAVQMTASGDDYNFILRVGEGQGERIDGVITKTGKITVTKRETSFNTCPICLASGTLIDTPEGLVPVEQLYKGMFVWTVGESGQRIAVVVMDTVSTPVPLLFQVVRITLNDGRVVTASPGHPTADRRALGDYRVGDIMDGGVVMAVERIAYNDGATYDLLPSGATGLYWANGILFGSTLWNK